MADGKPRRVIGTHTDIAGRRQAEGEILVTKNKLQATLDAIPDLLFEVGLDGRIYDYHARRASLLAAPPDVFLGKAVSEVLPPKAAKVCMSAILEAAEKGWSGGVEYSLQLPQGERWFELSVAPMHESDTIDRRFILLARDITERKQAEEKNRQQTVALESAANGIVITDKNGTIEWINPAWSALTGYSKEEAIGKNPRILKSGVQDRAFYKKLWNTILAGKAWRGELVNKRKDGRLYTEEETITPVLDEHGAVKNFIAIKHDITKRKQSEIALARTNQRLQSLRLIDHALLGATVEGGSADIEALRHLAALVPCGRINIIALDEISDSARFTARAIGDGLSASRVNEPVSLADLRLNEMQDDEMAVVKLEADKLNPLEKELYDIGGRALVKAPLIVQGKLIGMLALSSENPDFFSGEYLEIIKDVSAQLALSLHHANLLSEIRRHAEQMEKRVQERTAEIETTRQRLELAVNAGEIGVWEINFKENKVVWDSHMHLIHGTRLGEFDNSPDNWWRMIDPQDVDRSRKNFQVALERTGLLVDEHRIVRPDRSLRYVAANAVVLYGADHKPERMIGVNVDVTERREVEETMRRANLEMERALRIKDEFLANMSHELRTPLNAVMGISESLLEQTIGTLNEKQQKYIATINESGAHLLSLINDILDLSKIESGRMELNITDISVKSLFESSFRMVKEMALKKNITITFEEDARVQDMRGDPRRLLQMLVNLLSNAVKFTPAGGKAGVQVFADPDLNEIKITVWDTGIGIAEEDIPRLFQSFVQLDANLSRQYSGTGLGLMLVMQMARMHGGNIGVQSNLNEGSRFMVSLPWLLAERHELTAGKKTAKAESDRPSEKARVGNILLMEDTESIVMLVDDYLQAHGHRVLVARDGLSGLMMAEVEHPDLILLDIQMPGLDGFEVIAKLRADESLKNIPVIALTALAMSGDRERCLAAGMNDYMSKPIHLAELAQMIEQYLQSSA
jgi:PAS domain S-box-containing protein